MTRRRTYRPGWEIVWILLILASLLLIAFGICGCSRVLAVPESSLFALPDTGTWQSGRVSVHAQVWPSGEVNLFVYDSCVKGNSSCTAVQHATVVYAGSFHDPGVPIHLFPVTHSTDSDSIVSAQATLLYIPPDSLVGGASCTLLGQCGAVTDSIPIWLTK